MAMLPPASVTRIPIIFFATASLTRSIGISSSPDAGCALSVITPPNTLALAYRRMQASGAQGRIVRILLRWIYRPRIYRDGDFYRPDASRLPRRVPSYTASGAASFSRVRRGPSHKSPAAQPPLSAPPPWPASAPVEPNPAEPPHRRSARSHRPAPPPRSRRDLGKR